MSGEDIVQTFTGEAIEEHQAPNGNLIVELDDATPGALLFGMSQDDKIGSVAYVKTIDARAFATKILELCDAEEAS